MRDARARGSIIRGGVTLTVEIRRLQNAGCEKFGIGREHNHRADDLRIDSPLGRIGRLFQLGQVAQTIEGFRSAHIAERVAARNIERRVVDPFVGIADADRQRGQLG